MGFALITGASGGIGKAFTDVFAETGKDLILVARNQDRLADVAEQLTDQYGICAETISMDLSDQNAGQKVYEAVKTLGREVDVLVNNAGAFETGDFSDMAVETIERMMLLNTLNLTTLTRLFLDDMLAQRNGHILNVASLAAFQAMPGMACYAASKAFVLSFTEALASELQNTGVSATVLCPGFTNTDMALETLEKLQGSLGNLPDLLMAEAEQVAEAGYDACMRGAAVEVPGWTNKAFSLWSQTQPRWLLRKLAGNASRLFSKA